MKLAIGLLLAGLLGAADLQSGNGLLEMCQVAIDGPTDATEALDSGFCFGIIEGIADSLTLARLAKRQNAYCPPKGLTPTERIHAVVRYLKAQKPEELAKQQRFYWGFVALAELYPCEK